MIIVAESIRTIFTESRPVLEKVDRCNCLGVKAFGRGQVETLKIGQSTMIIINILQDITWAITKEDVVMTRKNVMVWSSFTMVREVMVKDKDLQNTDNNLYIFK